MKQTLSKTFFLALILAQVFTGTAIAQESTDTLTWGCRVAVLDANGNVEAMFIPLASQLDEKDCSSMIGTRVEDREIAEAYRTLNPKL